MAAGHSSGGSSSIAGSSHQAKPRSSAASGTSTARARSRAAALEQHPVAGEQRALGALRGGVAVGAERERLRHELVEPGGAEHGEQVEALRAREAGDGEALEHAGEAAAGRPVGLAREAGDLRAGALRPLAVGLGGRALGLGQVRRDAVVPARGGGRDGVLQRGADEREQEREPGRVLLVGLGGDGLVRAGREEPLLGGEQGGGEPLGVGGRAQAGDELVAVAVVLRAGEPAGDDAAAAGGLRRGAAGAARAPCGRTAGAAGPWTSARPRARASRSGSSR